VLLDWETVERIPTGDHSRAIPVLGSKVAELGLESGIALMAVDQKPVEVVERELDVVDGDIQGGVRQP
jgi:hypothetical protein